MINQSEKNIEIIYINDGSTDNSLNILENYRRKDDRIKIINQKNKGPSAARNEGIKSTKGKYIFFVDSNDSIKTNTISEIVKFMLICNAEIAIFRIETKYIKDVELLKWIESRNPKDDKNLNDFSPEIMKVLNILNWSS